MLCAIFFLLKVDDVLAEKMSYFRCRIYLSGRYFSNCQNDNFFLTHFNIFFRSRRRVRSALQIFKFFFLCWYISAENVFLFHSDNYWKLSKQIMTILLFFSKSIYEKYGQQQKKFVWKRVSFPSIWTLFEESVVSIEKSEKTCPSKNRFLFAINSIRFKRRGRGWWEGVSVYCPWTIGAKLFVTKFWWLQVVAFLTRKFSFWNFSEQVESHFSNVENIKFKILSFWTAK